MVLSDLHFHRNLLASGKEPPPAQGAAVTTTVLLTRGLVDDSVGRPVGRMQCGSCCASCPPSKHSLAHDGKCGGRSEAKGGKTERDRKTDRQRRRQEMSEIRTSNVSTLAPCHPLSSLEHPSVSQARGRFLGCSARRKVHVKYEFPVGPAMWLMGQATL